MGSSISNGAMKNDVVAEVHESLETTGKNDRRRNCLFDQTSCRLSNPISQNDNKNALIKDN